MERRAVKMDKVDSRRVSILVAQESNAGSLKATFEATGYRVDVVTEPGRLYSILCDGGVPGFVFISTQVEGPMAQMMPTFVVDRFAAPVFLFREDPNQPSVMDVLQDLPPEIVTAVDMDPAQMLQTVEGFAAFYDEALRTLRGQEASAESLDVSGRSLVDDTAAVDAREGGGSIADGVLEDIKRQLMVRPVALRSEDLVMMNACKVSDPNGQGHFLFAFSFREGQPDPTEALLMLESKIHEVAGENVQISHIARAYPASFFLELKDRSDEVVMGQFGQWEMVLLYFRDRAEAQGLEAQPIPTASLVPLEEWWTHLPLPVNAYVWMPLNGRKLLYIRSGSRMRTESYQRFQERAEGQFAVNSEDLDHYRQIREIVSVATARPGSKKVA